MAFFFVVIKMRDKNPNYFVYIFFFHKPCYMHTVHVHRSVFLPLQLQTDFFLLFFSNKTPFLFLFSFLFSFRLFSLTRFYFFSCGEVLDLMKSSKFQTQLYKCIIWFSVLELLQRPMLSRSIFLVNIEAFKTLH